MSIGLIGTIAATVLVLTGVYLGWRASEEARTRLRDIDQKAQAAKADEERRGRERAARDYERLQLQRNLESLLKGHIEADSSIGAPHRGDRYKQFPQLHAVAGLVREVDHLRVCVDEQRAMNSAYRKSLKDLQGQLDELRESMKPYI